MTPVIGSTRPRAASTRAILRELDPSSFKASAHQADDQSFIHSDGQEYRNSNHPDGHLLQLIHTSTNASTDSTSTGTISSTSTTNTSTSIPSITISTSSDSAGGHHHHQLLQHSDRVPLQPSPSSPVSLPEDVRNEHREEIMEEPAQAQARQQNATQTSSPSGPSSSFFQTPVRPTGPLSRAVASVGPGVNTANAAASTPASTATTTRLTGTIPAVDQHTIRPERVNPILRLTRKHTPAESAAAHHEPVQRSPLSNRPSRSSSKSSVADRHLQNSSPSKTQAMALKFLTAHSGSSGTSSSVKYFDIRLANDYIVFRGNEDESSSAELSGSVVLCLTDIMNISHISLTLSGIVHMSWQTSSTSSMSGRRSTYKEKTFFEKSWNFLDAAKGKPETVLPDNYEWPFQCILDGSLPESVEGLKDAWVIYRLKAEIVRKRGRDIVVRKPLRIVRTLDSSALELAHAMSVENIWPNKIEYSISIPNKAVAFGSFVQVDFKLIPLLKGLVIGNVSTQVREEQEFVVDPEWGVNAMSNGITKHDRVIVSDMYKINPESDEQILDEAAEGFQFSRYLELPKSLNQCLQDCNAKGIKVRHKVKFNVQLHNPDGHISELRANLPVSFYISPSLPINENNDLVDQTPQARRAAIANDLANAAPPVYGKHTLDLLYSDMDGYRTPGMTLSNPGTPYLHSRHASSDNLASLAAITNGNYVSPAALENRLQDLRVGGSSLPREEESERHLAPGGPLRSRSNSASQRVSDDYFNSHEQGNSTTNTRLSPYEPASHSGAQSGSPSQPGSNIMSRRTSEEEEDGHQSGARTPFPQYDHMEDLDLAKIPSYSTAVKTPAPRTNRSSSTLPTYDTVVREPTPPALAEPPTAHIRSSPRIPGSLSSSPSDLGIHVSRHAAPHRNVNTIQDEERRLRLLQQRAR